MYEIDGIRLILLSDRPAMPVEHTVRLVAQTDQAIRMQSTEIRGLSMYMGRIPVVWEAASETQWTTTITLGACTEPNMLWQLQLRFESEQGSHQLQLPFYSVRN